MSASLKLSLYGGALVAVFFAAFLLASLVTGGTVALPESHTGGH